MMIIQKALQTLLLSLLLTASNGFAESGQAAGRQLDIQVSGMTCPFCVYGLEKKLGKMKGVETVRVSLQHRKAQVMIKPGHKADLTAIRAAISDAGFTAGGIDRSPAAPVSQYPGKGKDQ